MIDFYNRLCFVPKKEYRSNGSVLSAGSATWRIYSFNGRRPGPGPWPPWGQLHGSAASPPVLWRKQVLKLRIQADEGARGGPRRRRPPRSLWLRGFPPGSGGRSRGPNRPQVRPGRFLRLRSQGLCGSGSMSRPPPAGRRRGGAGGVCVEPPAQVDRSLRLAVHLPPRATSSPTGPRRFPWLTLPSPNSGGPAPCLRICPTGSPHSQEGGGAAGAPQKGEA